MKRKTLKFLALLLSAMMILGFATVAFPAHGQPEAKLFVEPQNNIIVEVAFYIFLYHSGCFYYLCLQLS